jgi:hypothetical protein
MKTPRFGRITVYVNSLAFYSLKINPGDKAAKRIITTPTSEFD